jgi:hypothetical protein
MPNYLPDTFCVFILSHGRADNVLTAKTIARCGYVGRWYIVLDDQDPTIDQYVAIYGAARILVFDKEAEARSVDQGNNTNERRCILMARNACFKLAESLGVTHFLQFDDDYYYFGRRFEEGAAKVRSLNSAIASLLAFYESTPTTTIAFSQGGDHIGGFGGLQLKRKAMNSFLCSTRRPFRFIGTYNEDVNTYVTLGSRGSLFFTFTGLQLDQRDTQAQGGGITGQYLSLGTYAKSFTTLIMHPSSVRVALMQTTHKRLHHQIDWATTVPKIVSSRHKKSVTPSP